MIIVSTITEPNPRTGRDEQLVNNAFRADTLETVIMPCVPVKEVGARFEPLIQCWAVDEPNDRPLTEKTIQDIAQAI
jgi:hypothetical protein